MAESPAIETGRCGVLLHMSAKPLVRWWWLSGPFTEADIVRQLDWIKSQGFGGVELAWLAPRWLDENDSDRQRPAWLGPRWSELVAFTKKQAMSLDLRCDFTFGSAWPFGGSWLRDQDASQTFFSASGQRVHATWEEAVAGPVPVLNHLSAQALRRYAEPLLQALRDALAGSRSALFCDSLELETGELWSPELWQRFTDCFGYDLEPFAQDLMNCAAEWYDYRRFLADVIRREFYEPFAAICRENGALSRVQCHGAPTDLMAAYAAVDIPESEALLFPTPFSRIAASAAAWAGRPIVSAEAFTCLYGFPDRDPVADELWHSEDVRDLKLLADALFAQGVNQLVWHGMPYQPAGKEDVEFYASVHVAPNSPFGAHLLKLNRYFEQVCSLLREGEPHANIAVYLPWEDALMAGELSPALRTPGANYVWEMRYAVLPTELDGFASLWVSAAFLRAARVVDGVLHSGRVSVEALYVDCEWLDFDPLEQIARLLRAGAKIIWKRPAREPGKMTHAAYDATVNFVAGTAYADVVASGVIPLLRGADLPQFWARRIGADLRVFFANPLTKEIAYPMPHRFAARAQQIAEREVILQWVERTTNLTLRFGPYESILLQVDAIGNARQVAIPWSYPND